MKFLIIFVSLFFTVDAFSTSGVLLDINQKLDSTDLSGSVEGYTVRNRDDRVNFGIVMPLMSKTDIFNFRISTVISPEVDVIRALGQRIPVPSNVSIPNQRERYSFFTITLDKPNFRLPNAKGADKVGVLEGIFPFTKVVDAFRSGRPLFSLVNDFKFSTFSLSESLDIESDSRINLKVGNSEIANKTNFTLNQDVPRGYIALGLTLNNIASEDSEEVTDYFPTDLKTLKFNTSMDLGATSDSTPLIVMIPQQAFDSLANSTQNPVPFTLSWNSTDANEMLPLLNDLVSVEKSQINIDANEVNANEILGYKLSIFKEGGEVFEISGVGNIPGALDVDGHLENKARIRLDVFASNNEVNFEALSLEFSDLRLEEVAKQATLVSRYEIDFN